MHISEGLLGIEYIAGGYAVTVGLAAFALKKVKEKDIPRLSVMGACFFVATLMHFKIGVSSVHLTFIGLMGLVLGTPSVLAIIAGLFFQAVMFQHGGLTTLGINTAIFSIPCFTAYGVFKLFSDKWKDKIIRLSILGAILTFFGVMFSLFLLVGIIYLSSKEMIGIFSAFFISNTAVAILEGFVTFLIIHQILRIKPDMLYTFDKS